MRGMYDSVVDIPNDESAIAHHYASSRSRGLCLSKYKHMEIPYTTNTFFSL